MTRLIGAELFKLQKRMMTKVLLLILVGIMVVFYLLLFAISKVTFPSTGGGAQMGEIKNLLGLPVALPFAMSMLASFGSVLAVILVASSMGNEYNWRTIRTALTCSEGRLKFLGAKLAAAGILILIGLVVGLAAGFVMSLITTAIGGYAFDFSFATGSYLWAQFLQFWRTFFVVIPYALLAFLFSIVAKSAGPGIGLGIGVYFLESIITVFMGFAGGWIAQIPKYLLNANVSAITALAQLPSGFRSGGGMGGGLSETLPGVPHAYITLSLYSLAFIGIAFYLFRTRDVTG
ncbi:MAG: ABC transporter permease subunit [Dehalococcoidia bacterium]|nr:ABC transporter permease subunit [Dehalococcoidia bacterium]